MDKAYKKIEVQAGSSVEEAVNLLLEFKEQGELVCLDFNGVMLYSDTVTMDAAYTEIVGRSKTEHDAIVAERLGVFELIQRTHKQNLPTLTEEWISKGIQILDADKHALWAEAVPIRLDDMYMGIELGFCLDVVKLLNEGGTFKEATEILNAQSHSGQTIALTCSMISAFADRGQDFVSYVTTRE